MLKGSSSNGQWNTDPRPGIEFLSSLYKACSEHTKAYKCFAENLQTDHRKQAFKFSKADHHNFEETPDYRHDLYIHWSLRDVNYRYDSRALEKSSKLHLQALRIVGVPADLLALILLDEGEDDALKAQLPAEPKG
ncbi:hypothetical protein PROFUN_01532 [Planoprotostelium fungivorum]|uniref:Uncharacterized protein n=1 Tax=Planoprotostelium fungivorum TaxID=1890364 RepID=A0A2P6NTL8_9EUKA|nr:hypothetical protein PROFUN_01532 [Planoprotostelium fungivorum]